MHDSIVRVMVGCILDFSGKVEGMWGCSGDVRGMLDCSVGSGYTLEWRVRN